MLSKGSQRRRQSKRI